MHYNYTYFNFFTEERTMERGRNNQRSLTYFFHPEEYETERGNGYVMELVLLKVGT